MNAIELLKKDHRTVKSLFESFEKAKEKEEETSKADLFASIKEELDAHARVEEEIFYPAFDQAAEKEDDKELVLEAGEEHKQVKTLLAELQGLDPDDETFDAKMKVLKDNIEHHVKEEEGEMFPHAEKQLTGDELEQLGQRIAARKEEIQQQAGRPAARSASQSASSPSSRARAASPGRRSGRGSSSKNGKAGVAPASPGKRRSSSTGRSTGARRSSGGRASGRSTSGRSTSGRGRSSSGRGPSSSTGGRSASSRRGATSSRRGPASGRGGRSRGRGRSARS